MISNKIAYKGRLYAYYFNVLDSEKGLSFPSDDDQFIQVGIWNYAANKKLPAHFHKEFKRESTRTCESILVIKGKIKCKIFTKNGKLIDSLILKKNDMIVQLYGAHEYEVLEDCIVIENKNGPYFGPLKDRKRIKIEEN